MLPDLTKSLDGGRVKETRGTINLSCSQDDSRRAQYLQFAAGLPTPCVRGRGCNAGERAAWGVLQLDRFREEGFSS